MTLIVESPFHAWMKIKMSPHNLPFQISPMLAFRTAESSYLPTELAPSLVGPPPPWDCQGPAGVSGGGGVGLLATAAEGAWC